MKRILALSLLISILACGEKKQEVKSTAPSQDHDFDEFKERLVEDLWGNYPVWASYEGFHEYDDQLPTPSNDRRNQLNEFWSEMEVQLSEFKLENLSPSNQIDFYLIKDKIRSEYFYNEDFISNQWNPAEYNLGGVFFQAINYKKQPLEERLRRISLKLQVIEDYYAVARENINVPTEVHTGLAIQQLKGSIAVFEGTLLDSLNASNTNEDFKAEFESQIQTAVQTIGDFVDFLKEDVQAQFPDGARDFRIGSQLFEEKFVNDIQSSYLASEIYQFALDEKQVLHDKMYEKSEILWEKYHAGKEKPNDRLEQIQMVIDAVSRNHTERDQFIKTIRKQIPELEQFVMDKNLLTLNPEKPLTVRETPEYMRGFAGASISAPGPYDKNAETYYNVTPLDDYSEEEAESYLREYNDYTLQILNIHEAVPGHYTQLVYSNQSPSIIKSIFGNGAMVEGWAVYTEMMMLENGYGNGSAEMDLMYYKWNLRTVCNTILDYSIHVLNMTEEQAMDLMMKEAFQEQSEATGKWRRARLSQVQLCSYFTGFYEIRALREEIKALQGSDFNLKAFHENFLSYGSAPVKYIRKLMLQTIEEKGSLV